MERYEFVDGSSQKYWEVGVEANTITVRFGKIGTSGQVKTKTLASNEAAEKERTTLIKEKTAKGYVLCGQGLPPAQGPFVAKPPEEAAFLKCLKQLVALHSDVTAREHAVFVECLKQMHAPGLYLAEQDGRQTLDRLGGLPSLPTGVEWPLHLKTKRPLHFLAQVDLSTLPSLATSQSGKPSAPALPSSGMLFFFVDMGGDFQARVLYTLASGVERATPPGMPKIGHDKGSLTGKHELEATVFEPRVLQPFAVDTFHCVEDVDFEDDFEIDFDDDDGGVKASAKAIANWAGGKPGNYSRLLKDADIQEFWEKFNMAGIADQHLNDLGRQALQKSLYGQLGLPDNAVWPTGFHLLGSPMSGFYTEIEARKKGYVLLLSVNGHMLTPSSYDDGVFQFWIKPDDLAAARFDRAWATSDHS